MSLCQGAPAGRYSTVILYVQYLPYGRLTMSFGCVGSGVSSGMVSNVDSEREQPGDQAEVRWGRQMSGTG